MAQMIFSIVVWIHSIERNAHVAFSNHLYSHAASKHQSHCFHYVELNQRHGFNMESKNNWKIIICCCGKGSLMLYDCIYIAFCLVINYLLLWKTFLDNAYDCILITFCIDLSFLLIFFSTVSCPLFSKLQYIH